MLSPRRQKHKYLRRVVHIPLSFRPLSIPRPVSAYNLPPHSQQQAPTPPVSSIPSIAMPSLKHLALAIFASTAAVALPAPDVSALTTPSGQHLDILKSRQYSPPVCFCSDDCRWTCCTQFWCFDEVSSNGPLASYGLVPQGFYPRARAITDPRSLV
ncbi:hypothetical protein F4778DRAFT_749077 [Xylariomycetidae sp. FL2044]|nr:hypothetical protein F4778DRAFT_749077 [Xylariomycetidae sp. FL2044]